MKGILSGFYNPGNPLPPTLERLYSQEEGLLPPLSLTAGIFNLLLSSHLYGHRVDINAALIFIKKNFFLGIGGGYYFCIKSGKKYIKLVTVVCISLNWTSITKILYSKLRKCHGRGFEIILTFREFGRLLWNTFFRAWQGLHPGTLSNIHTWIKLAPDY